MFSLKNLLKALAFILVIAFSVYFAIDIIQDKQNIMSFEDYDPPSSLIVEGEEIKRAKYPFVDVHSHQWRMGERDLNKLAAEMDGLNMGLMVNLSGGSGKAVADAITNIQTNQPKRFILFANLNFNNLDDDWGERAAEQLQRDYDQGARGKQSPHSKDP